METRIILKLTALGSEDSTEFTNAMKEAISALEAKGYRFQEYEFIAQFIGPKAVKDLPQREVEEQKAAWGGLRSFMAQHQIHHFEMAQLLKWRSHKEYQFSGYLSRGANGKMISRTIVERFLIGLTEMTNPSVPTELLEAFKKMAALASQHRRGPFPSKK